MYSTVHWGFGTSGLMLTHVLKPFWFEGLEPPHTRIVTGAFQGALIGMIRPTPA
jgi:hypothetical protein